eukprot:13738188-Ditylum_brightwellii.AAC.1
MYDMCNVVSWFGDDSDYLPPEPPFTSPVTALDADLRTLAKRKLLQQSRETQHQQQVQSRGIVIPPPAAATNDPFPYVSSPTSAPQE